jgi:hypothetical protein
MSTSARIADTQRTPPNEAATVTVAVILSPKLHIEFISILRTPRIGGWLPAPAS